jgi:hypothetical protein
VTSADRTPFLSGRALARAGRSTAEKKRRFTVPLRLIAILPTATMM